eukprot:jgi/Ulvmu1/12818/UM097_0047.1
MHLDHLRTPGLLVASASEGNARRKPSFRRTPPRQTPLLFARSPRCHTRSSRPALRHTLTLLSCFFACCVIVCIALKSGVVSALGWGAAPHAQGDSPRAFGAEIVAMEAVGDEFKSGARTAGLMLESAGEISAGGGGDEVAATLVLYIFSNTDPQYYGNLLFFIKHGMPGCPACEYVVVINQDPGTLGVELPELPDNARYLHHPNQCYDWGTFGWVLKTEDIDTALYKHFIFLNSSVRGPFLPPYLKDKVHFTEAMTSKLVGDVKMVGPTINCEGTATLESGERRSNPHVQSFAVATDAIGMELLVRDGKVFGCYDAFQETIYHSELGASAVILEAGYNLDSFMGRYQGVDWRDKSVWECNAAENPFNYARVDGVSLAPMELMFVKVKHNMVLLNYPSALAAVAYDDWYNHTADGTQSVLPSLISEKLWEFRAPFILEMAAVGPDCFDCAYYQEANADLASLSCWQVFTHFINYGQFEMRPHRFTCDTSLTDKAVPYMPAEDGQAWPRPTTAGCSAAAGVAGRDAGAEGGEDLRAQVEQYRQEVETLRDEIAALTDVSLPGGDDAGGGGE